MKMKYVILLIIVLIAGAGNTQVEKENCFPLKWSLFNESTAVPFTRFMTLPIHPGIRMGTEFRYTNKVRNHWLQTVNASYFYHRNLVHGIGISTETGYEYRSRFGLSFSVLIGLGYLHTFSVADEYVFKNGTYSKRSDLGNARFAPSLSLQAAYYFSSRKYAPCVFMSYESWIEFPYSPGFIPLMSHINLHIGTKFFFGRKTPISKTSMQ